MRALNIRVFAIVMFATACLSAAHGATFSEQDLDADLKEVSQQIADAEQEARRYTGGLIVAQIQLRLAILGNTQAMIQQRKLALQRGVTLEYRVNGNAPKVATATELADLKAEVETTKQKLLAAENQAAHYSGGLIMVMALTEAATLRSSLAILEQKEMALRYGIPLYAPPKTDTQNSKVRAPERPGTVVNDKDAL